ncbi:bifunctional tRNA (5-methylaminomethyl-2-thiouridine)(34)-methyltransferase MnmD/FAD-dependent 5-carboxymethylaminomethyl-2-thiouridine(34) oxidoreductase MnmC [Legionella oakridgensis]|uniref:tRNA 5-methylaminomethyl-2-thiouridine biosynthesis bifunctional protein MnmC n=2 Tax=Legionella oakridgensis TaxID=29423 RepID=W0BBI1_9GAMM|nr:bifunctional tRNA (5-methylaminomethyl-2-thiouridine)(34)-methyltransferase MnmD/FAD-dependent 5-carboxymethylaminomethyl-2-thiouridine(34) oxidoreductase MnmC [Legionella oakridgensis]AHE67220.1 tRNA U-34 5-methylaminomethyl-2-thiouridine biosynthesis protein MnmC, C-terminal domain protein [Legionella oakridgensis ATCC 33761 = DSM 21215]ETO93184.1 tRNA U-34 5-methylaminomethyl-2-thiouridine biosynthesis protein MnmC [Legionella oakridgensis RV-2-2007]KTD37981.1 FAD dependent oxidoreductase 
MSTLFEAITPAKITWTSGLPYSCEFEDIYFSTANGLQEASHVFIDGNQLRERWEKLPDKQGSQFVIAETGFGSGLNFLLAWSLWQTHAPKSARLHFISCEKHPLTRDDLLKSLSLWPALAGQSQALLESYPILTPGFHLLSFEGGRVNLILMLGDALACYDQLLICGDAAVEKQLRHTAVDAWFLDGFSPKKNPDMWCEPLFTVIGRLSRQNATLATFSAAGIVKRGLQAVGFTVNKKKGYGCKREMITAVFDQPSTRSYARYTPWHASSVSPVKDRHAMIVGGGLAGCYSAYALARRGWKVTLIDEQKHAGEGASGNRRAVLYPKISSYRSPLTEFMLTAYVFAIRAYKALLNPHIGHLGGGLQLAYNSKEQVIQAGLRPWLTHYPELGRLVNHKEASLLAGIILESDGLFVPHSGWIDSLALCQFLIESERIHWVGGHQVNALNYVDGTWSTGQYQAEVLIIASGHHANQFSQTSHLPLKPIRGQMTIIKSNEASSKLNMPLCADGHVLPAWDGGHYLGATYHLGSTDATCQNVDNESNLAKLDKLSSELTWSKDVINHWSAIRAATPDYLPLVGPVAQPESFKQHFAALASNAQRWLPFSAACLPGLYVCAGFGSRGLTSIPISAEWLAAMINREPHCLPRKLIQAISPARFLRREIIRSRLHT